MSSDWDDSNNWNNNDDGTSTYDDNNVIDNTVDDNQHLHPVSTDTSQLMGPDLIPGSDHHANADANNTLVDNSHPTPSSTNMTTTPAPEYQHAYYSHIQAQTLTQDHLTSTTVNPTVYDRYYSATLTQDDLIPLAASFAQSSGWTIEQINEFIQDSPAAALDYFSTNLVNPGTPYSGSSGGGGGGDALMEAFSGGGFYSMQTGGSTGMLSDSTNDARFDVVVNSRGIPVDPNVAASMGYTVVSTLQDDTPPIQIHTEGIEPLSININFDPIEPLPELSLPTAEDVRETAPQTIEQGLTSLIMDQMPGQFVDASMTPNADGSKLYSFTTSENSVVTYTVHSQGNITTSVSNTDLETGGLFSQITNIDQSGNTNEQTNIIAQPIDGFNNAVSVTGQHSVIDASGNVTTYESLLNIATVETENSLNITVVGSQDTPSGEKTLNHTIELSGQDGVVDFVVRQGNGQIVLAGQEDVSDSINNIIGPISPDSPQANGDDGFNIFSNNLQSTQAGEGIVTSGVGDNQVTGSNNLTAISSLPNAEGLLSGIPQLSDLATATPENYNMGNVFLLGHALGVNAVNTMLAQDIGQTTFLGMALDAYLVEQGNSSILGAQQFVANNPNWQQIVTDAHTERAQNSQFTDQDLVPIRAQESITSPDTENRFGSWTDPKAVMQEFALQMGWNAEQLNIFIQSDPLAYQHAANHVLPRVYDEDYQQRMNASGGDGVLGELSGTNYGFYSMQNGGSTGMMGSSTDSDQHNSTGQYVVTLSDGSKVVTDAQGQYTNLDGTLSQVSINQNGTFTVNNNSSTSDDDGSDAFRSVVDNTNTFSQNSRPDLETTDQRNERANATYGKNFDELSREQQMGLYGLNIYGYPGPNPGAYDPYADRPNYAFTDPFRYVGTGINGNDYLGSSTQTIVDNGNTYNFNGSTVQITTSGGSTITGNADGTGDFSFTSSNGLSGSLTLGQATQFTNSQSPFSLTGTPINLGDHNPNSPRLGGDDGTSSSDSSLDDNYSNEGRHNSGLNNGSGQNNSDPDLEFGDLGGAIAAQNNIPNPNGQLTATQLQQVLDHPPTTITHTTQSGDNLSLIAQRNNTTVAEILSLNPSLAANPNNIRIGQEIQIPQNSIYNHAVLADSSWGTQLAAARARGEATVMINGQNYATFTGQMVDNAARPLINAVNASGLTPDRIDAVNQDILGQVTRDGYQRAANGQTGVVLTDTAVSVATNSFTNAVNDQNSSAATRTRGLDGGASGSETNYGGDQGLFDEGSEASRGSSELNRTADGRLDLAPRNSDGSLTVTPASTFLNNVAKLPQGVSDLYNILVASGSNFLLSQQTGSQQMTPFEAFGAAMNHLVTSGQTSFNNVVANTNNAGEAGLVLTGAVLNFAYDSTVGAAQRSWNTMTNPNATPAEVAAATAEFLGVVATAAGGVGLVKSVTSTTGISTTGLAQATRTGTNLVVDAAGGILPDRVGVGAVDNLLGIGPTPHVPNGGTGNGTTPRVDPELGGTGSGTTPRVDPELGGTDIEVGAGNGRGGVDPSHNQGSTGAGDTDADLGAGVSSGSGLNNSIPPRTNFADTPVHESVTIADGMRNYDSATLEAALRDPAVAARIADETGVSPKRVERDAAILISRENAGTLVSGEMIPRSQLEFQAGLLGHNVESLPEVYRLDGRSPEEIIAAGGFLPNPNKAPSTLWEHTAKGADGGGSFVSTSVIPSNRGTLLNSDFWDGSRVTSGSDPLLAGVYDTPQTLQDVVYIRYEYRIKDTEGVVLRDASYVDEAEAVIRGATPDQIEVREIRIVQRWREQVDVDADGTTYIYDLTPIRQINPDSDISNTAWRSLSDSSTNTQVVPDTVGARNNVQYDLAPLGAPGTVTNVPSAQSILQTIPNASIADSAVYRMELTPASGGTSHPIGVVIPESFPNHSQIMGQVADLVKQLPNDILNDIRIIEMPSFNQVNSSSPLSLNINGVTISQSSPGVLTISPINGTTSPMINNMDLDHSLVPSLSQGFTPNQTVGDVQSRIDGFDFSRAEANIIGSFNEVRSGADNFQIGGINSQGQAYQGLGNSTVIVNRRYVDYSNIDSSNIITPVDINGRRTFTTVPETTDNFEIIQMDPELPAITRHEYDAHIGDYRSVAENPSSPNALIIRDNPSAANGSYSQEYGYIELNGFRQSAEQLSQSYVHYMALGDTASAERILGNYNRTLSIMESFINRTDDALSTAFIQDSTISLTRAPGRNTELNNGFVTVRFNLENASGRTIELETNVPISIVNNVEESVRLIQSQLTNGANNLIQYREILETLRQDYASLRAHYTSIYSSNGGSGSGDGRRRIGGGGEP